jgi:hypothetical protein
MAGRRTLVPMSAQPAEHDEPYERVPASRLRHLEAIERHAPAEVIAEAEAEEAAREAHRQRVRERWDEMLAQATPEQRAWAEREAARLVALNR